MSNRKMYAVAPRMSRSTEPVLSEAEVLLEAGEGTYSRAVLEYKGERFFYTPPDVLTIQTTSDSVWGGMRWFDDVCAALRYAEERSAQALDRERVWTKNMAADHERIEQYIKACRRMCEALADE